MAVDTSMAQDVASTLVVENSPTEPVFKTPGQLANIVTLFAASDGWMERVRLRTDRRWYERLHHGPEYDIWLISWLPGQSTGFHDHGASAGAFVVSTGVLEEHRLGEAPGEIHPGQPCSFGPGYAHDVRNVSPAPAISIHAYSPPLSEMNEFELEGSGLVPRDHGPGALDQDWRAPHLQPAGRAPALSIDQLLVAARVRLRRLSPRDASEATAKGEAILVDIRPDRQRATEGAIEGAWIVERNVLEWRFDPASDARLSVATGYDLRVIVFCSEGYTSSLAAAALQDLGLFHATDIIGGFQAWQAAGLPITSAHPSADF